MDQKIQYCTSADGVRIAYSSIGKGPPIVRASHWLSHLEYDLKSPVWRHLVLGLADRHTLVRYDARGTGLSDRNISLEQITFENWVGDLETVADALNLGKFTLLGISQGSSISIAYTRRHPERVSNLILFGGFQRGHVHFPEQGEEFVDLSRKMIRQGWGSDNASYRQWFTSQFIPEATTEQARWFNELEKDSASPEVAERMMMVSAHVDVSNLLPGIDTPTLVLHTRGDIRVPFERGQEMAGAIPRATFVPLEGKNHIFLANEPAHREFFKEVASFLGDPPIRGRLFGTERENLIRRGIAAIEHSLVYKIIIILAAVTGLIGIILSLITSES